jgi:TRAP transporter TAXI family solute receptor
MNFKWWFPIFAAVMVLSQTVAVALGAAAAGPRYVSIAAGEVTGANYSVARIIAEITWKHLKPEGVKVSAETSGGSLASARLIGLGDTDFAIIQNDIAADAFNGRKPLFEKPIPELQGVCSLFSQYVQLVCRADTGITSVADLRGKRVGIGPDGSGTAQNAKQVLDAWGLTVADLSRAASLDFEAAMAELLTGGVDAVFATAVAGFQPLSDLARTMPLSWVPIAGPAVDRLIDRHPCFTRVRMPAGVYAGNRQDVATVSVRSLLVARKGLEPEIVHALLTATYADLDPFRYAHSQFRNISPATGLLGMSIPLHPGAQRFFAERGLLPLVFSPCGSRALS